MIQGIHHIRRRSSVALPLSVIKKYQCLSCRYSLAKIPNIINPSSSLPPIRCYTNNTSTLLSPPPTSTQSPDDILSSFANLDHRRGKISVALSVCILFPFASSLTPLILICICLIITYRQHLVLDSQRQYLDRVKHPLRYIRY